MKMFCLFLVFVQVQLVYAIMAGGEFSSPADSPSNRLVYDDIFNYVGALEILNGGCSYRGSAVALSPHWVLSAGHNVDFNDDGAVDGELVVNLHLPGFGIYEASSFTIHPDFTGFGKPSIQHDLSLLYFESALPELLFPTLGLSLTTGEEATLIGFGRSGYGSYGYTTVASLTNCRVGYNVIDEFEEEGGGILYRYDFDSPDTTVEPSISLGNDRESIIGPGDSGGALLVGNALVGINTFTEGYGGRFGDIGGGVALNNEWDWIAETTGLAVPEPSTLLLFLFSLTLMACKRSFL